MLSVVPLNLLSQQNLPALVFCVFSMSGSSYICLLEENWRCDDCTTCANTPRHTTKPMLQCCKQPRWHAAALLGLSHIGRAGQGGSYSPSLSAACTVTSVIDGLLRIKTASLGCSNGLLWQTRTTVYGLLSLPAEMAKPGQGKKCRQKTRAAARSCTYTVVYPFSAFFQSHTMSVSSTTPTCGLQLSILFFFPFSFHSASFLLSLNKPSDGPSSLAAVCPGCGGSSRSAAARCCACLDVFK